MTGKVSRRFWACFERLPEAVQNQARSKYRLWRVDPFHPSLHFKELAPGLWSVRITLDYRALGRRTEDGVVWFWIGNHDDYDKLIAR